MATMIPAEVYNPRRNAQKQECCIRGALQFWNSDNEEWTNSTPPKLPSPTVSGKDQACLGTVEHPGNADVTVIQANSAQLKEHVSCLTHLQSELKMPDMWFKAYSRNSNSHFGSEVLTDDAESKVTGVITWCCLTVKSFPLKSSHAESFPSIPRNQRPHYWDKLNMFTKWDYDTGKTTIIIFNLPSLNDPSCPSSDDATLFESRSLFADLKKNRLKDPFWAYTDILGLIAEKQTKSVWNLRTMVRDREKQTEIFAPDDSPNAKRKPRRKHDTFAFLHGLTRHLSHGKETLNNAVAVTESLLNQHSSLGAILAPSATTEEGRQKAAMFLTSHHKTQSCVHYHLCIFQTLFHRATSNQERLMDDIQLVYNETTQDDADASYNLAKAAQIDSAAMKTIAFITTAFLPATFVATIFSTSFFNYEQGKGWRVSGDFWLYWACAIPTTVVALITLQLWQKYVVGRGLEFS